MKHRLCVLVSLVFWVGAISPAAALKLRPTWPDPDWTRPGEAVTFPSRSPFGLNDVGTGGETDPPATAHGTYYAPQGLEAGHLAPAAVLLHGAGGIIPARELAYGHQLSAMGIASLVIDSFGPRADPSDSFADRLIHITEAMLLADAFAALDYLATRPEIDSRRVVLIGFSYGAMAATYAAFEQVSARFRPDGHRFLAHVAYCGPCIARFEDHRATGAAVLMLYGERDEIIDPARCKETAADLRNGGAQVDIVIYPNAYHQWDGNLAGPERRDRNLAPCRFRVDPEGYVLEDRTGLAMTGPFRRRLILGLCTDSDGYLISRDDSVRVQSNAALAQFLARVLGE